MSRPRVRERILDAAHALLDSEGAAGLTTRAIAARAGVTEASVFNNFGDKSGLIQALVTERLTETRVLAAAIDADIDGDVGQWLAEVFVAACNYFRRALPFAAQQLLSAGGVSTVQGSQHFERQLFLRQRLQRGDIALDAERAGLVALSIMGAAAHCALTSLALGQNALQRDERSLGRDFAALFLR